MEYKLREEVINKVLNYLASKPYTEVAGLIRDLQTATPIKEIEETKEIDSHKVSSNKK